MKIHAGIDLGAHSLRLIDEDKGLVFDEPALAAFNTRGDILAIGDKAMELKGQDQEEIRVVSPIENGYVDFSALEAMLNELCYEYRLLRMFRKTILLICCPTVLDEELMERLKDSLLALGAHEIYFHQEIWIAAIGSGLDLYLPVASSVMNIGFSNCDLAVFKQGEMILRESSSRLNGQSAAAMVERWLLEQEHVKVSSYTLDALVQNLGNVRIKTDPKAMEIRGVDSESGMVRTLLVTENDLARVLVPLARELGGWVSRFLDSLSETQAAEIRERGIVASGGFMKIDGLGEIVSTMADCPVYITDEPDKTVALGVQALLKSLPQ